MKENRICYSDISPDIDKCFPFKIPFRMLYLIHSVACCQLPLNQFLVSQLYSNTLTIEVYGANITDASKAVFLLRTHTNSC